MKKNIMLLISIVIIGTLLVGPVARASTLLRVGSRGNEVRVLQTKLSTLGYSLGAIDGIYGPRTKAAVMNFQRNSGIQVDGIVGPVTIRVLDRAIQRQKTTNGILAVSKSLIGIPYAWGGSSPSGFDCSGFTKYVFAKNGITIPRVSRDQYKIGRYVPYSSLKAGDLVFFSLYNNGQVSHVGIYIGNGRFINASSSKGVTIYSFTSYWLNRYVGAKRIY